MYRTAPFLLLLGLLGATVRADPLIKDAGVPALGPAPSAAISAPTQQSDFPTAWRDSADVYAEPPIDPGAEFLTLLAPPPAEPERPDRTVDLSDPAPAAKPATTATPAATASPLAMHTSLPSLPSAAPPAGGIVAATPVTAQGFDRSPYFVPAVNEAAIKVIGGKANAKSLIERAKDIPKPLAAGVLLLGALGIYAIVRRR